MNHSLVKLFSIIFLVLPFALSGQSDVRGFEFGLNFGVYKPSKYSANYYNGSPTNVNNINWVLSNQVFYDTIYYRFDQRFDAVDTLFVGSDGFPTNMHYKLAVMPGLYGQYTFNEQYALYFDFNYSKLTTQDALVFTLPLPYLAEPRQVLCPIRGVEERVYFDIGLRRNFKGSDDINYFLIGGLTVNNTTVIKSAFFVDEKEFTIINNYINGIYIGPNSQTYNTKIGGLGWGLYFSGGASLHFGNIVFEPGINAHFVNVDLDGYKKYRPGIGAFIRFNLNSFLFGGEE